MQKNKIIRLLPHHVCYSINRWPLYIRFMIGIFIGLLITVVFSYFYFKTERIIPHSLSTSEKPSIKGFNSKYIPRDVVQPQCAVDFGLIINSSEPPIHHVAIETNNQTQLTQTLTLAPQNEKLTAQSDQAQVLLQLNNPFQQFSTPEPQSRLNLKPISEAMQQPNKSIHYAQTDSQNTSRPRSSPKTTKKESPKIQKN